MDWPAVLWRSTVASLAVLAVLGSVDSLLGRTDSCPSESGVMPTPIVAADGEQMEASLFVHDFCGGGHGDGPLMFGEPAVVLTASSGVVVKVPAPFVVRLSWTGEQFVARGDGSYVSPGAPPGCHRLDLEVADPASDTVASFGVDVAMQSTC